MLRAAPQPAWAVWIGRPFRPLRDAACARSGAKQRRCPHTAGGAGACTLWFPPPPSTCRCVRACRPADKPRSLSALLVTALGSSFMRHLLISFAAQRGAHAPEQPLAGPNNPWPGVVRIEGGPEQASTRSIALPPRPLLGTGPCLTPPTAVGRRGGGCTIVAKHLFAYPT